MTATHRRIWIWTLNLMLGLGMVVLAGPGLSSKAEVALPWGIVAGTLLTLGVLGRACLHFSAPPQEPDMPVKPER